MVNYVLGGGLNFMPSMSRFLEDSFHDKNS